MVDFSCRTIKGVANLRHEDSTAPMVEQARGELCGLCSGIRRSERCSAKDFGTGRGLPVSPGCLSFAGAARFPLGPRRFPAPSEPVGTARQAEAIDSGSTVVWWWRGANAHVPVVGGGLGRRSGGSLGPRLIGLSQQGQEGVRRAGFSRSGSGADGSPIRRVFPE